MPGVCISNVCVSYWSCCRYRRCVHVELCSCHRRIRVPPYSHCRTRECRSVRVCLSTVFVLQVLTVCLWSFVKCVRIKGLEFVFVRHMYTCCKYRHYVYVHSQNVFVLQVSALCLRSLTECVRVASIDYVYMFTHRMCSCCKYRHCVYVHS